MACCIARKYLTNFLGDCGILLVIQVRVDILQISSRYPAFHDVGFPQGIVARSWKSEYLTSATGDFGVLANIA